MLLVFLADSWFVYPTVRIRLKRLAAPLIADDEIYSFIGPFYKRLNGAEHTTWSLATLTTFARLASLDGQLKFVETCLAWRLGLKNRQRLRGCNGLDNYSYFMQNFT
jgi:hypothetical protein